MAKEYILGKTLNVLDFEPAEPKGHVTSGKCY